MPIHAKMNEMCIRDRCCNASKGQRLLAYQCAEDGGEFMVERLGVWVFITIFSLCFQYEVAAIRSVGHFPGIKLGAGVDTNHYIRQLHTESKG